MNRGSAAMFLTLAETKNVPTGFGLVACKATHKRPGSSRAQHASRANTAANTPDARGPRMAASSAGNHAVPDGSD